MAAAVGRHRLIEAGDRVSVSKLSSRPSLAGCGDSVQEPPLRPLDAAAIPFGVGMTNAVPDYRQLYRGPARYQSHSSRHTTVSAFFPAIASTSSARPARSGLRGYSSTPDALSHSPVPMPSTMRSR